MDILDKIKKLLALSTSPNANEAASALRRAQELMEEYGIDHESVLAAEIVEKEIERRGGAKPPAFEAYLITTLARAFGCRTILRSNFCLAADARWVFIGLPHRAEVASYLGVVLLRKLAAARRGYVKTLYRCKRDTKTKRADEFCLGWVSIVGQKIHAFVGSEADEALLNQYMRRYDDLKQVDVKQRETLRRYAGADYFRGGLAARDVELQHGMRDGANRAALLEGGV